VALSVDRLRQTYAVDNAHSQVTLLRIAKDAGLRVRITRLTWDTLLGPGEAYPALVLLANGGINTMPSTAWQIELMVCEALRWRSRRGNEFSGETLEQISLGSNRGDSQCFINERGCRHWFGFLDPEARLYRKGKGKEAKLSYIGNALTENRHGLVGQREPWNAKRPRRWSCAIRRIAPPHARRWQGLRVLAETRSDSWCLSSDPVLLSGVDQAAIIFSFVIGNASRKVCTGVLPKHRRPWCGRDSLYPRSQASRSVCNSSIEGYTFLRNATR
jgi:hypothetical protein